MVDELPHARPWPEAHQPRVRGPRAVVHADHEVAHAEHLFHAQALVDREDVGVDPEQLLVLRQMLAHQAHLGPVGLHARRHEGRQLAIEVMAIAVALAVACEVVFVDAAVARHLLAS